MRTAEVEIPLADERFFMQLCQQHGWMNKWTTETRPDLDEDDP